VSLSFELTRSGLVQLNKAEAKVVETYLVEVTPPKNASKGKNATNETEVEEEETPKAKPEKVQKKRTIPYPLNRIDRVNHGLVSLTKE
jgi:hypothetical protein